MLLLWNLLTLYRPIMAIIGGVEAPPGRVMGHAGAWTAPGEPSAHDKINALEKSGVTVVDHPEKFGDGMKKLLAPTSPISGSVTGNITQKRGFHTGRKRPHSSHTRRPKTQTRALYIKQSQAVDILKRRDIATSEKDSGRTGSFLAISIDRSSRSPCIIAAPSTDPAQAQRIPFEYGSNPTTSQGIMSAVSERLGLGTAPSSDLTRVIQALLDIFMSREAFVIETNIARNSAGKIEVLRARFGFDDAAHRSAGRQKDTHALRDVDSEDWSDVEAEKFGMIWVKLQGEGSIGTIVNGAGLAMNTVDALVNRGGSPANFCDTGGKATSDTIKSAFRIVTADERVKVIFVNIFGGLTLAEMIAEGIIKAFNDLGLKVPVVVRLRGTNEALGQKMIRDSGLKMDSFDSFEEAAARVIGLAKGEQSI